MIFALGQCWGHYLQILSVQSMNGRANYFSEKKMSNNNFYSFLFSGIIKNIYYATTVCEIALNVWGLKVHIETKDEEF